VNQTEANGGHRGDRTLDRTRSLFDRTRSVSAQRLRVSRYFDRTWWRVRSRLSLLDSNRTSGVTRPVSSAAHPVADSLECCSGLINASGQGPARPVKLHASGLCDQRVRSARLLLNLVPNSSIQRGTSINTRWLAQDSHSCIL
jgi:hypothetical protein